MSEREQTARKAYKEAVARIRKEAEVG